MQICHYTFLEKYSLSKIVSKHVGNVNTAHCLSSGEDLHKVLSAQRRKVNFDSALFEHMVVFKCGAIEDLMVGNQWKGTSSFRKFCQAGVIVLPFNWGDPIPDKVTLDDGGPRRGPDGVVRTKKETEVNSTSIALCNVLYLYCVVLPIPRHDVPRSGKCDGIRGVAQVFLKPSEVSPRAHTGDAGTRWMGGVPVGLKCNSEARSTASLAEISWTTKKRMEWHRLDLRNKG